MRIFFSSDSEPMILDSVSNLNKTYAILQDFLNSEESTLKIKTIASGSPEPYSEFLTFLKFKKTHGKISVKLSEERGLIIAGSKNNLFKYIKTFIFKKDGEHNHPEFSLIHEDNYKLGGYWPFVESDNDYVKDNIRYS